MLGGHSEAHDATPEVQALVKKLKRQIESRKNKVYTTFQLEKYTTQVVNGLNYKLKVKVNEPNDYVHITAHQPPSADAEPEFQHIEENKKLEDEL